MLPIISSFTLCISVGLKLSCLDPATAVDLKYLGIHLPLPPPELPEQSTITSPSGMLELLLMHSFCLYHYKIVAFYCYYIAANK